MISWQVVNGFLLFSISSSSYQISISQYLSPFNHARSGQSKMRCCEVLENIKDGRAIASKYASEIIRFRTPNVVIVFSNADPDMTQLSKDRWRVFHINKEGLSAQENILWELRHTKKSNYRCRKQWILFVIIEKWGHEK